MLKNIAVFVLAFGMIGIVKNNHNRWSWDTLGWWS